jgi:ubiquinone/menaquinone biosynthesis C-methylase UbiE
MSLWDAYTAQLVEKNSATATDCELLSSIAEGCVLDAGCGIGKHLSLITKLPRVLKAVGVDAGFEGLRYARCRFSHGHLVCGTVSRLPFRDCSFDFIYCIDVIEHLIEPLKACRELYRVLKTGGRVFIQTPNYPVKRIYDLWHVINRTRQTWKDDPTHVSKFSSWKLVQVLRSSGFRIELVVARNLVFQNKFRVIARLRGSIIGRLLGQKVIVVGRKLRNET